jgi:hypothetical protein
MKKSQKKIKDARRRGGSANTATPHSIQIVFVDTNGKTTYGPLMEMPHKPGRKRKLDDAAWNRDQTIRRFCRYLQSQDDDGLEAAMRALDRLDCWCSAVDQLKTGPSLNIAKGRALLSFWNGYGINRVGKGLKGDLPQLIDAFRYLLPPYTGERLTLYRGEVESRHTMGVYGVSWTSKFKMAKTFANRREPDEGHRVVLQIEATPSMIVVAVKDYSQATLTLEEDEYIVDPRLIDRRASVIYRAPDEAT